MAWFRILQNGIDCVVLNACFSQVQAEAIAKYVPYVLGMNIAIGDLAAIDFAKGFYGALFEGKSVKESFDLGKNQIALKNIPEAQTPVFLERRDRLANWTSHSKYAQFFRFVFAISSLLRNVYCFVKKRVRLP
jgi:hypothetical protein